jgi:ferric-dicitrate binding protein FerR (iron transport regulator)
MTNDTGPIDRSAELLMRELDGELEPAEGAEFERLLSDNPELRDEWDRLSKLKEVTANMKLRNAPEEMWDGYWNSVYSRFERGLAWILVSLGAIVVGSWGAWYAVKDLMADADLPTFVKWSILALMVGLVMLLVSVLRHRIFVSQSDPYKEIER